MMIFIWTFIALFSFADSPSRWSSALKIVDKHEFYQNNEVILKPRGSWEVLFAFIYADNKLNLHKDCVFYRVPDEDAGIFKIKITKPEVPCEKYKLEKGDFEINDLKSLQFSISKKEVFIHFTYNKFKAERWDIPRLNDFHPPEAKMLLSSADFQSSKILMLSSGAEKKENYSYKTKGHCHDIDDDCNEKSSSSCHECRDGWFEVPNGCEVGPKFCGIQFCGGKNQPACRKGYKFQRIAKKYECRLDSSFAYCNKGLTIQCEGSLAYCR